MSDNASPPTAKILLVDDESSILDLLREILGAVGYRLECAANGAEALAWIARTDFDLIITDFRMPVMTGKELYDRAVKAKPGIENRFVFISGELDPAQKTEFIHEAGVRVIAKPFRFEEVRKVVRDALHDLSHTGD